MRRVTAQLLLIAFLFAQGTVPVLAQAASASPAPVVSAPPSVQQQENAASTDAKIAEVRTTYRNFLSIYRNDEKNFQIAKSQNVQLNTLASLEGAVRATRQVMLSRDDVLISYLMLLQLNLAQTKGIDISLKNSQLSAIDAVVKDVKKHRLGVDAAVDRSKILTMVTDFIPLQKTVQNSAYKTLTLITYGRMQTVYDKTQAIFQEVQQTTESEEKDALRLAEKKRAFEQIKRDLEGVDGQLKNVKNYISQNESEFSQSSLSQVTEDLGEVYGSLSLAISHLQEVVK
jgi:hypothetical protein